jgi:tetratricopeptide (TPR) repeat protein
MKRQIIIPCLLINIFFLSACNKSEFLDVRPDNSLVVPQSLEDCQFLLDNDGMMNGQNGSGVYPSLSWNLSDDYFIADKNLVYLSPQELNQYKFNSDVFLGGSSNDWNFAYRCIFYSNEILSILENISISDNEKMLAENIKGSALFHRAFMHYGLVQDFAPFYDKLTASNDLGIPLRRKSDINEEISRSSVQETYNFIIEDLLQAIRLLPVAPKFKTRPSKQAAYALLARAFQTMQDYEQAYLYADSCLQLQNSLLDFNSVEVIPRFNDEVLFHTMLSFNRLMGGHINPDLIALYDENDLRKSTLYIKYFSGLPTFYGSYNGDYARFAGLATDEVYLIRAECLARKGKVTEAMQDLNLLLINRFKAGTFEPLTTSDASAALDLILIERRKELLFRGTRGVDLKRLNKEGRNITVSRIINGESFQLLPNSNLYTYPIPPDVISFNPEMPQNIR